MYAFINDLSIAPNGVIIQDNWQIIKELLKAFSELKKYNFKKIRVPAGFVNIPITGSHAIANYLHTITDTDERNLLFTFIANYVDEIPEDIAKVVEAEQENKLVDVYYGPNNSSLLTEATLMDCPSLSLSTHDNFRTVFLNCEYIVYCGKDATKSKDISIPNIFSTNNITTDHSDYLVQWKKKIVFSKTKWNPIEKPIWNEHTATSLTSLEFPQSIEKKADKKEELRRIGSLVAEMNGWEFDEPVTKKNKNSGQLRKIFRSVSGNRTAYLSIDFERANGCFEVHDYKGTHKGQIDFLGEYNDKADPEGFHNIII